MVESTGSVVLLCFFKLLQVVQLGLSLMLALQSKVVSVLLSLHPQLHKEPTTMA